MNNFSHKKSLGQHFLNDEKILKNIVSLVKISNENIIEIGPGKGSLTKNILCQNPKKITLIEKDKRLESYLAKIHSNNTKKLDIIFEDALKVDLRNIAKPKVILIEGGFSLSPFLKRKLETMDISNNIQQSLYVIFNEATKHNYVPVCFYQDTYLVRDDLVNDNFKKFDAVKLYMDAFNFLPVDHRENLLTFRSNNKKIKEIETNYFGNFKSNPLDYDGK